MNSKKPKILWISELEAKEKWLEMLAAWLGLQVKCSRHNIEFDFEMEHKRWWLELKGHEKAKVLFPGDTADYGKYAFDSVENLLAAVFSTHSLLVFNQENHSAYFLENKFSKIRSREELEIFASLFHSD